MDVGRNRSQQAEMPTACGNARVDRIVLGITQSSHTGLWITQALVPRSAEGVPRSVVAILVAGVAAVIMVVVIATRRRSPEPRDISEWHDGLDALDRIDDRHHR